MNRLLYTYIAYSVSLFPYPTDISEVPIADAADPPTVGECGGGSQKPGNTKPSCVADEVLVRKMNYGKIRLYRKMTC